MTVIVSLLYVPFLHATHFDAKLHIEICFQKIIPNTQCSHSVMVYAFALWDFQDVEHSQTFVFLTKLNAIVSIFHPHSPFPADASHFIPLKW